ncbi:hypothetical protein STSV2_55 [Sulfolobus virus STSV2]|uniref:hypothetical protein n=1 Tax=Sulfolobus virus STSV2 TaxID=1123964 RepID=UPI0002A806A9|nr:hypothetical protein STSV2_55 [Sulfolobus virus STSV2]AFU92034.1 hypothetical protein STSV2_55 [Sulfolobus virus STSV2]
MSTKCPICGENGTLYIKKSGKRKYYYINHNNKKHCYLGPVDEYVHVVMNYLKVFGKLHLTNVRDADLIAVMMEILDVLEERYKGSKDLKLKADLRMIRDRIGKILEESDTQAGQDEKQEQKVVEIIEGDGKDGKVEKPVEIEVQHL